MSLKKGKLYVTWAKAGILAKSLAAETVEPSNTYQFNLIADKSRIISYRFGNGKMLQSEKPPGPLGIGSGLTTCIGDTKSCTWDRETADREEHTPFKGRILHLSIGTGKSSAEIEGKELAQFGAKKSA